LQLSTIVKKSLTPLLVVNIAAMVASGVWLTAKGYILAVWPAVLALLFSPLIFPILILPAAMCAGIMQLMGQAKPLLGKVMAFMSVAYLVLAFTFYIMLLFRMMAGPLGYPADVIPAMVFGVTAALAPWTVLAAKDRENIFFTGLVLMAELTAVIVMCCAVPFGWKFWFSAFVFLGILTGMVLLQALYEKIFLKKDAPETPLPPTTTSSS
jgi:hypothetical protein